MTPLDIANYIRSLSLRDRENLKRGIQLTEATASAELAKETKNGD